MTIKIIDPHLHLFDRSRGDYHWLNDENPPFWPDKSVLQRNFSIEDLINSLKNSLTSEIKLSGFVHIEAGFNNQKPWYELDYIESIPLQNTSCKSYRTIASVDLLSSSDHFEKSLYNLQQHQSLIGVRHILDEQALTTLSSQLAQKNMSRLNEITDFIFELQLPLADKNVIDVMPLLTTMISKNNQLRFIINHAGFPPLDINSSTFGLWQKNIQTLAKYPNLFIKCSGWEMTDRHYAMEWFGEVSRFCIEAFSIQRVMLASNFPLCLLHQKKESKVDNTYASYWHNILQSEFIKQCNQNKKSALLYNNALRIYKLEY